VADEVFLSPSLRPCIQPVGAARAHSDQVPRAPAHIFVRQFGILCTHTGGTPVLREAHMTQFTKMFAVFWLGNGHCDRTVLGRRIAGAYQRQHVCSGSDRSGSNDP
jgi:hypothetical protein